MSGPINRSAELEIKDLRALIRFDSNTGKLFWLERQPSKFRFSGGKVNLNVVRAWNAAHANHEAFTATDGKGYKTGAIHNRIFRAHRVCFALYHGYWPDEVDHIDGDRGNNKISNLRSVSSSKNRRNVALSGRNTSGVCGVGLTITGSWRASIGSKNHTTYRQKTFKTKAEAITQRAIWEKEFDYHENHGKREAQYENF